MKRLFFFTVLMFCFFTVSAKYSGWSAAFYLPNDSMNGGWTENRDDFRSFGLVFELEMPLDLFLSTEFYGLTARPDVSRNQLYGTRSDEFYLTLAKNNFFNLNRFSGLYINPSLGFLVYGNLGGAALQNKLHENVDLPDVSIDYSGDAGFLPALGVNIVYLFSPFYEKAGFLFFESETAFKYIPSYALKMELSERVKLDGASDDTLFLSFGFRNDFICTDNDAVIKTADKERGLIVKYGINTGILYFLNEIDVTTRNSVGSVGLKWRFKKDKRVFQKSDFSSEIGFSQGFGNTKLGFYKLRLSPWENTRLNMVFDLRYGNEKKDGFPDYRNVMQILSTGVDASLFKPEKGFNVNPFISGMFSFTKKTVTDVSRDHTYFYMSPAVMLEAGIRITREIPFISSNTLYGFAVSDTIFFPFTEYDEKRGSEMISHIRFNNFIGMSFMVYADF